MKQNGARMLSGCLASLAVDRSMLVGLTLGIILALASVGVAHALPSGAEASADAHAKPPDASEADRSAVSALTKFSDRVWGFVTLYDNPDNPVIEKFAIRGRFQADFPLFHSDQGHYSEAQVRRFRLGFKSRWFADLLLHVEADLDLSCEQIEVCDDDAYEGLTDAYLGWAPNEAFEIKVGKMSAPFTLDGSTSSNHLLTLERNNVSNNLWFPVEYHAGIRVSGEPGSWRYLAGVYSSSTTEEFGSFDGGVFLLLTLAHDFSQRFEVDELLLSFNYVYNESDPDNVSTRDLAHVGSMQLRFESGRWAFIGSLRSYRLRHSERSDRSGIGPVLRNSGDPSDRRTLHLHPQLWRQRHPFQPLREPYRVGPRRSVQRDLRRTQLAHLRPEIQASNWLQVHLDG